ncbi:MAG: hypothetical protein M0P30_14745, partial [Syntrophorhabdaceae bacterium]|nr:hypothetical protein [Syntrophorhabdaceae bacterium]
YKIRYNVNKNGSFRVFAASREGRVQTVDGGWSAGDIEVIFPDPGKKVYPPQKATFHLKEMLTKGILQETTGIRE